MGIQSFAGIYMRGKRFFKTSFFEAKEILFRESKRLFTRNHFYEKKTHEIR